MSSSTASTIRPIIRNAPQPAFAVLGAISFCHLLNDMMQALLISLYPMLKSGFDLSFGQIGVLSLVYQMTASLLQPLIGAATDRRPMPYSLSMGMVSTGSGLLLLATASNYPMLLAGATLLGIGSSVFHPEASRIARLASGGRHGLAQSMFQVGGNFGQSLGPLLTAFVVLPHGQGSLAWFCLAALTAMTLLGVLGRWYQLRLAARGPVARKAATASGLPARQVAGAVAILLALMFSKFIYMASMGNYYVFYLMDRFGLTQAQSQVDLFVFMGAGVVGILIGGPVGDRIGPRRVIWGSILGVLPFTLALPYAGLATTVVLSAVIGLVLSSAFSAIVVYAQELLPGRVGMISGLFFGLAFGLGGIGAAAMGWLADATSVSTVFELCAFLPAIGLLAGFLPRLARG